MFPRAITVMVLLLLGACRGEPAAMRREGWQGFSLGTMPLIYAAKGERRYLVSVPRRYLDEALLPTPRTLDDRGNIIANNIRFGVRYPSLEPASDAWAKGSIRVTIGNMVADGISRSVDGSWDNYYSVYTGVLPDQLGLQVRRREDGDPLGSLLYFRISPDLHVRIECLGNMNEADKWCIMVARRPGEAVLTTGFYRRELPGWHQRFASLHTLFRSEGRQVLAPVPGRR